MRKMQTLNARNMRRLGKHGRPMKDETGQHQTGGDSGGQAGGGAGNQQENNQGGNSGGASGSEGNQNNSGSGFDAASFWNQPSPEAPPAPNSGSAAGGESGGGQNNEGNAFAERLNNLAFAKEVFTPDAIKAMNEGGDPKAFNENMTQFGRQAVRESVVMAAQLMQRNNSMIETRMKEMLDERFGTRDSEEGLGKEFPSYSKPGMKPMIDGIYAQAMRLTKGDRTGAIAMTKEMLKHSTQTLGTDFGITTPPGGAGDGLGTQTNWEEELLGR